MFIKREEFKKLKFEREMFEELYNDKLKGIVELTNHRHLLEKELETYRVKDLIKEIKGILKTVPKNKFVSEILVDRQRLNLITTETGIREMNKIIKNHFEVTEVACKDRIEVLIKDASELEEWNKLHTKVEVENEKEQNKEIQREVKKTK